MTENIKPQDTTEDEGLWQMAKVCQFTGMSRPFIYTLIGRGEFPKQVRITPGRVAWRPYEVRAWVDNLPTEKKPK